MDRRCSRADGSNTRLDLGATGRWAVLLALTWPAAALAQLDFTPAPPQTHFAPYADTAYEVNSNLFDLSSSVPDVVGSSGPTRSDQVFRARAGFDGEYDFGLQELLFNAEGRRFIYDHFTDLDHDEYLVHGGLKWKIASLLDGLLDYQRERSMVSFLEYNETQVASTQLFLQVQTLATASINLQVTPEWRLQSEGKLNELDSPRPGLTPGSPEEDLAYREESIHEGIRYVGFANLSFGLDGEYLNGHFTSGDFVLTPRYHQSTVEFAADYVLSGLSTFHGELGYTDRVNVGAGSISGVTFLVSYQRALTGKTSIIVKFGRALNTYVTYADTEIDTTAELDALWHATEKIAVQLGYQYLHSSFAGSDIAGLVTEPRVDNMHTPSLSVRYQPLNWLLVKPYFQYQTRSSSVEDFSFNGTLYGIELEARLYLQ